MRRHTTKHPSGAATTARPNPARRARIRKGSATSCLVARTSRGRLRLARQIVPVVVMVLIKRQRAGDLSAEQSGVLGMLGYRLRHTRAAHVAVEADHAVALRHDDVQIVRHEEHAEAAFGAEPTDQGIKLRFARVVDAARRLVEHKHARRSNERTGEHHALQLAARELRELTLGEFTGTDIGERPPRLFLLNAASKLNEASDRDWNGAIDCKALWHVAHNKPGLAQDRSAIGRLEAEQHPHKRRLAGPVGTDESEDLALGNVDIDALQNGAARAREPD